MSSRSIKALVKSFLKTPITMINSVFLRSYIKITKPWDGQLNKLDIADGRVLILAPHQDDEIIGCGSLIHGMVRNGCKVKTVFFTDGANSLSYEYDRESLKSIRKEEAKKVAEFLNMEPPIFMDFPDGELEVSDTAAKSLSDIIDDFEPDYVFFPYFLDGHKDHVAVSGLLLLSLKHSRKNREIKYFAYEVNSPISSQGISHYFSCNECMDIKAAALEFYKSQTMSFDSLLLMNQINASLVSDGSKAVELYKKIDISLYKKAYENLNSDGEIYKKFGQIYSLYFMIPRYLKGIKYKRLASSMLRNN